MAEVYAGFVSYTDHELARLIDYLEESGQLDNTIIVVVSDNGASAEGGPNGSFNEMKFFNNVADSTEENLQRLDELGGPKSSRPCMTCSASSRPTSSTVTSRAASKARASRRACSKCARTGSPAVRTIPCSP